MSHVAKIAVEIKDLAALKVAAKELGLVFKENQKTYRWYGTHVGDYALPTGFSKNDLGKCDHALVIEGNAKAYEIGIVKRKDGKLGFELLWDFWSGGYGLTAKIGDKGQLLTKEYTIAAAQSVYRGIKGARLQSRSKKKVNGKEVVVLTYNV